MRSHQSRSGAGGNPYHQGDGRAVPSDASHTAETNRRPQWRGNLRSLALLMMATRSASDPHHYLPIIQNPSSLLSHPDPPEEPLPAIAFKRAVTAATVISHSQGG